MHLNLRLAAALAAELPPPAKGGQWELRALSDVKLRAWIPPGESLQMEARLRSCESDAVSSVVTTRIGEQTMGGARVQLQPGMIQP
jgi:hypothetical protein